MATLRSALYTFLGVIVLLGVSFQPATAGTMVKVWELDLGKGNKAAEGYADKFPVMALSFSPDGKRIALTGGATRTDSGQVTGSLLIVTVGNQQGVKTFEEPGGSMVPDWSPSGDTIVVDGILVQLETGVSCSLPSISRFLSEEQIVGETRDVPPARPLGNGFGTPRDRPTHIAIYDKSCRSRHEWQTLEGWNISDVSTDQHLMLMNKPLTENLLVEPEDGHVVRRWSIGKWPVWDGPGGQFTDSGKALCGSVGSDLEDVPKGQSLRCWKTDSGELIGYAPADRAGAPVVVSQRSTRVVFSEYGYIPAVIRDRDSHPYKAAVVWDYATGERLASWRPDTQTWYQQGLRPPKKIVEPSKFAISPDGQFVAEGGNGKLTVYKIQR